MEKKMFYPLYRSYSYEIKNKSIKPEMKNKVASSIKSTWIQVSPKLSSGLSTCLYSSSECLICSVMALKLNHFIHIKQRTILLLFFF